MPGGELYFIRERNVLTNELSSFVKIGRINQSDTKTSEDRCKEHQTGNPRELFVHHVVKSPEISHLEKTMHGLFAEHRVRTGEWFRLSDLKLQHAINDAEQMALELIENEGTFEALGDLKEMVSTEVVLQPSQSDLKWFQRSLRSRLLLKTTKKFRDQIGVLNREADERGEDTSGVGQVQEENRVRLDLDRIKAERPDLYAAFEKTTIEFKGPFRWDQKSLAGLELAGEWPEFEPLADELTNLIESVSAGTISIAALGPMNARLRPFEARAEHDLKLAEANIRQACGTAAGILGVCKWRRFKEEVVKFDKESFTENYPDLVPMFYKTTVIKKVKKAVVNHGQDDAEEE